MATLDVHGTSLDIAPAALAAACREAERAYPEEGCGFLSGPVTPAGRVDAFRAVANVQDERHAADPRSWPRTARDGFTVEPAALLSLAREEGDPVKALMHSHPDGDPFFSAADREAAMAGLELPAWPLQHLIVAVRRGQAVAARLFDYDAQRREFVAVGEFTARQCAGDAPGHGDSSS